MSETDTTTTTATDEEVRPTYTATRTYDQTSHITWLDCGGTRLDSATYGEMRTLGWRYSRYREEFYTNRRWPRLPANVTATDAGAVHYAEERADRLDERAGKHKTAAGRAFDRAHAIGSMIPMGQPILVGHHSEKRHRRDLDRIDRNMRAGIAEQDTAADLAQRAASSRAHQTYLLSNPGAMQRRIETLTKEIAKLERAEAHWTGDAHDEWARRLSALRLDLESVEERLAAAGGLPGEVETVRVGDTIKIHGFLVVVTKVNKKTIAGHIPSIRMDGRWEKSWFQGIVRRAGEAAASAASQQEVSA